MTAAAKFAISLPASTFRALEEARKRRRVSRSALVAEALRAHFVATADPRDAEYVRGYARRPELESVATRVAAAILPTWSTWED